MSGSIYGRLFQVSTWGESHGAAIGVVIDGCPAGLKLPMHITAAMHTAAFFIRFLFILFCLSFTVLARYNLAVILQLFITVSFNTYADVFY